MSAVKGDYMETNTTAIIIAVAAIVVVVIIFVLLAKFVMRRPWILLVTAVAFGTVAYFTNNPDWYVGAAAGVVWWLIALACKRKSKAKPDNEAPKKEMQAKGPRYKSLEDFAEKVESDPKEIDANIHAVICDLATTIGNVYEETDNDYGRAILNEPVAALKRIAKAQIADKSNPVIFSMFSLADFIEEKKVKLDPAIRAMLTEVYDYCELYELHAESDCEMSPIAYDLERALYPNGLSASQSEAAGKRQARKEAAIEAKMKRAAP